MIKVVFLPEFIKYKEISIGLNDSMKMTIFYSWQSTTAAKYNRSFISDCIKGAVEEIKKNPDFSTIVFEIQDAIRDEPGQIAVADTILQKRIPDCDIFIADLSVVNSNHIALLGDAYKPFTNNNVMAEYGVAINSIGKQRIVSVLNAEFGSPKDTPEIIPFDLRQDRFPIEYSYSSDNENEKKTIKKQFVSRLVYALTTMVTFVLQSQKSKYRPFVVWNEWNEKLKYPQIESFIENSKIQEIQKDIQNSVKNSTPKNPIRVLGLSGLGKTRILFETFRPQEDISDSLMLSNRILYLNCLCLSVKFTFL